MISIIVPTYNESKNIQALLQKLEASLEAAKIRDYELLIMDDDSPDGTCAVVSATKNPKVRAINRRGKARGLSYAVLDGFNQAQGDILGVMDADLSHPVSAVPLLIEAVRRGENLAVGSRYVSGGGIEDWPWHRKLASQTACWVVKPLTPVRDATSGFFFFRKPILKGVSLNPLGFKIGLEMIVKSQHQGKVKEVPYIFTDRQHGQSKLSPYVIFCYLKQIVGLTIYKCFRR